MHIPDGYLDLVIALVMYGIAIIFWAITAYKARDGISEEQVPLLGILTAGVFVAQMLNFPIAAGTSGHLLGATLLAIVLGPWATLICMTVIFVVQALIFGDGGITALGANFFNMGIIGAFVGYYTYKIIKKFIPDIKGKMIGAFVGGWISVVLGAIACGIEIGVSQIFPYGIELTVPAMVSWHILIGIGEGLITAIVIGYIAKVRDDLLKLPKMGMKEEEE